MRISEVAALVGVTPRAVRHYHHQGLLPEPVRLGNGYRDYGLREAVVLARIRRLTELGLALEEVRDVLTDDRGRELVEVLEGLDESLGRQEAALRERRTRLRAVLAEARAGRLADGGPLSPEVTRLLAELDGHVRESPMAAKDRDHLAYLDGVLPAEQRAGLMALLEDMRGQADTVYALLDGLADASTRDPRVATVAAELAALLPDGLAAYLPGGTGTGGVAGDALFGDLAPAQSAAVRRALETVTRRARDTT
ncbi:MerR family transcriptional regulator [Streptomyces sp. NPDC054784]